MSPSERKAMINRDRADLSLTALISANANAKKVVLRRAKYGSPIKCQAVRNPFDALEVVEIGVGAIREYWWLLRHRAACRHTAQESQRPKLET